MVENLDSSAGDVSVIPNWGTKIPRAMGQLNLHATTLSQHSRKKKVSLKKKPNNFFFHFWFIFKKPYYPEEIMKI